MHLKVEQAAPVPVQPIAGEPPLAVFSRIGVLAACASQVFVVFSWAV